MVQTAAAGKLKSSAPSAGEIRFMLAGPQHDAQLRRLLRDTPMPGQISLSLQREPSYFAAARIEGDEHQTIVAARDNRVICAGAVSYRQRFINGNPLRVGYLSGLRLDASARGQASLIRRGFEMFRKLHERGGPPVYLTSIVEDNLPARRLLERGLSGMPTYRFLGRFVTLVIRRQHNSDLFKPTALVRRRLREMHLRLQYGTQESLNQIAGLLSENRAYQFAPAWSAEDLRSPGVGPDTQNFRLILNPEGQAIACAALWDQRAMKQAVVHGYSPRLARFLPLINLASAFLGRPRLPAVNAAIAQAFISHLAVPLNQPQLAEILIRLFHGPAHSRAIDYFALGFDERDPRLMHLRKTFAAREYTSRLYAVHWEDGAALAQSLDDRLLAPEAAIL